MFAYSEETTKYLKCFSQDLQENQNLKYYLVSTKWLQDTQVQDKEIINADLAEKSDNVIKYPDINYNYVLKQGLVRAVQFEVIGEDKWKQIHATSSRLEFTSTGDPNKFNQSRLKIRLVPVHQGVVNIIEGYQQVDSLWTVQELIHRLEAALQHQCSYQVDNADFIRLYTLPAKFDYLAINDAIYKQKQLVTPLENGVLGQIFNNDAIIIMDIKEIGKDYYFPKQEQVEQVEQCDYNWELNEMSKQGTAIYDNQTTFLSCLLKCYECVDIIRESIAPQTTQDILKQAYYGCSDYVSYDAESVQQLPTIPVIINLKRMDHINVGGQDIKVILDERITLKSLLGGLAQLYLQCPLDQIVFTSSDNNGKYQIIDYSNTTLSLLQGNTKRIRKLTEDEIKIPADKRIRVTVRYCIKRNNGFIEYVGYKPIDQIYVDKETQFKQMHHSIGALNDLDATTYTALHEKKEVILEFMTNQKYNVKCEFCNKSVCNNCEVAYTDKVLNINQKDITIYYISHEQPNLPIQQIEPMEQSLYSLIDYIKLNDDKQAYQILSINNQSIGVYQIDYTVPNQYQIQAAIGLNEDQTYNAYCLINKQWHKFGEIVEIVDDIKNLNIKLIICVLK